MLQHLLLIRHAKTQSDSAMPAAQWRLSHEGREECAGLAKRLRPYAPTLFVSSTEPKAIETAQLTAQHLGGLPSMIAAGLQEHDRSNVNWLVTQEAFDAKVRQLFVQPGELVFGTETADQAHARFTTAVEGLVAEYPEETLAIVTHGTVMSMLVGRANNLNELTFWENLQMPDVVVLEQSEFGLVNEKTEPPRRGAMENE